MDIVPFLWFNGDAEEAANFYCSVFNGSKVINVSRYGEAGPGPAGAAMVVEFELQGKPFKALNGFNDSPVGGELRQGSIALYVDCDTQAEVDRLWDALSEGGEKVQCGWLTDKYGFYWNIVPAGIIDYVGGDDPEGAKRAMQAMMQMEKLDIGELKRAYEGATSPTAG